MEEDFPPQYCSIPWSFRVPCAPFHGIGVDAERECAELCCK